MTTFHHLVVDGEYFAITEDDVGAVSDAVVKAVRNQGAFVELPAGRWQRTEVLVTPMTPVRWEHVQVEAEHPSSRRVDGATLHDLEWWLDSG